jgi:hypothetical protein
MNRSDCGTARWYSERARKRRISTAAPGSRGRPSPATLGSSRRPFGEARLGDATFTGSAGFGGTTFKRFAGFDRARFEQARQLRSLLAYRAGSSGRIEVPTRTRCRRRPLPCPRVRQKGKDAGRRPRSTRHAAGQQRAGHRYRREDTAGYHPLPREFNGTEGSAPGARSCLSGSWLPLSAPVRDRVGG